MGLQYNYCAPMIEYMRKTFGFDKLIDLVDELEVEGAATKDIMRPYEIVIEPLTGYPTEGETVEVFEPGLKNLFNLGQSIQSHPHSNASTLGSRGINAGLVPVILKIAPELGDRLHLALDKATFQVPDYIVKPSRGIFDIIKTIFGK